MSLDTGTNLLLQGSSGLGQQLSVLEKVVSGFGANLGFLTYTTNSFRSHGNACNFLAIGPILKNLDVFESCVFSPELRGVRSLLQ